MAFTQSISSMSAPTPRPSRPALRRLVDFYDLRGADNQGRRLEEILAWNDEQLEWCHDYIQTLFPLSEESMFADAPVVDEQTYLYWREHDGLQRNMRRAFERMLSFYGFNVHWKPAQDGGRTAEISEKDGAARTHFSRWVKRMDHNHLRITRIIRSLRVLGLQAEAAAFHEALTEVCRKYGRIGDNSQEFWRRALERPLYLAPDDTEIDWLEKYEVQEEVSGSGETAGH